MRLGFLPVVLAVFFSLFFTLFCALSENAGAVSEKIPLLFDVFTEQMTGRGSSITSAITTERLYEISGNSVRKLVISRPYFRVTDLRDYDRTPYWIKPTGEQSAGSAAEKQLMQLICKSFGARLFESVDYLEIKRNADDPDAPAHISRVFVDVNGEFVRAELDTFDRPVTTIRNVTCIL